MLITSLGVRYGRLNGAISVSPTARFDGAGIVAGGSSTRKEFDVSVGYSLLPGLTATLIYKRGEVGPSVTTQAEQLLGLTVKQVGTGLLLGLSANGPISDRLSLYGTAAYGPSNWKQSQPAGTPDVKGRYSIGEVGLVYRLSPSTSDASGIAWALQVGYRTQLVHLRDIRLDTYSMGTPPQVLSTERRSPTSTTHGLIVGVTVAL